MPSYIELDKQLTIPASSDVSKIILGVNTSNALTLTNNLGVTTPITKELFIPNPSDYTLLQSYNTWVLGSDNFGYGGTKWQALDEEYSVNDYIQLELVGGTLNGTTFSLTPTRSVVVPAGGVIYRDDGYGVTPVNYIDFINEVFSGFSLYTTFSGTSADKIFSNYCRLDNFILIFKEVGVINDSPISTCFYSLKSNTGYFLIDYIETGEAPYNINLDYNNNYWVPYIPLYE